ncbi:MAG: peptidoglycan editing factor PgeF [Burkholderiales bacterium]|nr:peptidoglycan editing factor PgeF [Burkholderiales bacterium]
MTGASPRTRLAQQGLDWIVPAWHGPERVCALFTTRDGGHAAADFDAGPAHPTADEVAGNVGECRRRLRAWLPADPVWLEQVHGRDVVAVDAAGADALRAAPPRADAALTRSPGVVLSVRVADCLPVLLADRAASVVAVAHAGWRGLAAGVLETTVAAMQAAPGDIAAWIGPAIGPRAFEVGADVRDAHCADDAGASAHFAPVAAGKWLADLPALARRRLAAAGVADVVVDGACTHAEAARFHSWRRDRTRGRMALVAWLAP